MEKITKNESKKVIIKRITKKESKEARMEFNKIIQKVRLDMKEKYKFCVLINGSAKFNCIVKDTNGEYDIDYRIILTRNCKSDNYSSNPKEIRNDFFKSFQKNVNELFPESYNCEQSKSVITLIKIINNKRVWSYDVCIIKEFSSNEEDSLFYIAKNSQGNNLDGGNAFTWCDLGKYNKAYFKFKQMNSKDKQNLIEEKIIPKKIKNKLKNDNDVTKKTSEQIFIEEVNNYLQ